MSEAVAIVHDWLTSMRGAERVVEALYRVFPRADLFTLTWDPARLSPALRERRATTSAIHRVATAPLMSGRFRALLPLFPRAVESFNLDRYGLVVSSSHCVAIGALAPPTALHVAYVHSTMRYAREAQHTYEASVPGGRLGRVAFRGAAHYLRRWELEASSRPHLLIANSSYTRDRIRRYYQRDAQVIEPPIETRRFELAASGSPGHDTDGPFLVISALVPNKRVELALRAFQGRPERLIVVGDGPERDRLERLAGPNVTLIAHVDDRELAALLSRCKALVHPGVDDFGMVMVEALAAGKPVLACAEGGALDIVHDAVTGLLIGAPTVDAVHATLDRFARRDVTFDPDSLRRFARRFDRGHFERRFAEAVDDARSRHHPPHGRRSRGRSDASRLHRRRPTPDSRHDATPVSGERRASVDPRPTPGWCAPGATSKAKRAIDVALAASALCVGAPLLAAIAGLIALDTEGPVLFHQVRVGLDRRPFTMVKLRTLDSRARATAVGRWLRPLGLDEVPQLWNILVGDMSFIGPRPEVPDRVERYRRELTDYDCRHAMRPGITGLAQVRGLRGDHAGTIADRLAYDLRYVREWSLALDAKIALETLPRVLVDTFRALRG